MDLLRQGQQERFLGATDELKTVDECTNCRVKALACILVRLRVMFEDSGLNALCGRHFGDLAVRLTYH
jgi:hypothetical protein